MKVAQIYKGKLTNPSKINAVHYLKRGYHGKYVLQIQKFLNCLYPKADLEEDGKFGALTEKQVKKFQKDMRLTADGVWGVKTYAKAKKFLKPTNAQKCVAFIEEEHKFVKKHGKYFARNGSIQSSWAKTKSRVEDKKVAGISCCYPFIWYLRSLGLETALHGDNGSFKRSFGKNLEKYLTRITKGDVIGLTVKQAVDRGLLKKGDIITFKGCTHSVTYTGSGYKVYDGGSVTEKLGYSKTGIKVDYSEGYYKKKKISEICRWK